MAFEGREEELGLLLGKMRNAPEDWHELYEQVRQTLNQMKATGMPLPQDLVQFEQDLEAEFEAEKTDERPVAFCRAIRYRFGIWSAGSRPWSVLRVGSQLRKRNRSSLKLIDFGRKGLPNIN